MNQGFYDVAIVGAGPSGSLTAYHLAKSGCKVALLDTRKFPRDKACGGGIQTRATPHIPFAWDSVVKSSLSSASFSYRMGRAFSRSYPSPLVHCVLRTEFDDFLLQKAREMGASIFEGTRTVSVENKPSGGTLETPRGPVKARYIIGADGANSIVGQGLNRRSDYFWQAALYVEVPLSQLRKGAEPEQAIRIDWGTLPSGYAWVFPKDNVVNIGAGCPVVSAKHLRKYMRAFLHTEGLFDLDQISAMKLVGHQLPTLTSKTSVARDSILLVGDAAGLVEPLTGEGISYACHSAALAAETLLELFGQASVVDSYCQKIKTGIGAELIWSRRLLSLATSFPQRFYRVFETSEEVWALFCRVLRGERTFRDLRSRIIGPLDTILGHPIDLLIRIMEQYRLARPVELIQLNPDVV